MDNSPNKLTNEPEPSRRPVTFGRQVQYGVQRPTQYLQPRPIALSPTPEASTVPSVQDSDPIVTEPEIIELATPTEPFVHPAGQFISSQQAVVPRPKKRRRLIAVGVAGLLIIGIGATVAGMKMHKDGSVASTASGVVYTASPQSYQSAVSQFIVAFQKKDKATADKMQTSVFSSQTKTATGTTSFYDNCQKIGKSCTVLFSGLFISPSKTTDANYTAADKTIGKSISYSSVVAGGTSATTLTINAVRQGSSWQIDGVDVESAQNTAGGLSQSVQGGISAVDQVKVVTSIQYAQTKLESYFAENNYYPGNLLKLSVDTLPTGVSYSYNATPVGCTTENKKCTGFALQATSTIDGTVLISKTDLNR